MHYLCTLGVGGGTAGNLTVRAAEAVELRQHIPGARGLTGILANSLGGNGTAGTIVIDTGRLVVRDGASVATRSGTRFADGRILPRGQGGNIMVNARESVEISGISPDGIPSTLSAGTFSDADAGTVTITTGNLFVSDGGQISVEMLMRSGSKIATDAGKFDGGNITIDTRTLAALENSDITANAEAGRGGRVSVTATGIFGTQFREQENPATSDITATSNLGPQFSGTVEINTPEVDPSSGLVQLPANFINAASLIGRDPCNQSQESEFIITGRGGLPPNPLEALTSDAVVVDWATTSPRLEVQSSLVRETPEIPRPNINRQPIVEATGWIVDGNGDIILVSLPSPASINHLSVVTCSSTNDP
ncbi:MAG: hypothetical protein Fur0025_47310 [Oscillatoriaceae cyanobacterium]